MATGTLVIILLVCAAGGFVLGAIVMTLFNSDKKATGGGSRGSRYLEIVRLFRDADTGKLLIEIDGRILSSANSLSGDHRSTLRQAARDWYTWLGLPAPFTEKPAEKPAAPIMPSQRAAPVLPSTPAVEPIPATIFPPVASSSEPRLAPLSIVGQIDEILQEKIAGTPLQGQGIRLAEEPRQGVVVWIGTKRYPGIDSVPEGDVKTVIRSAVAEWEKRSEASGRGV